MQFHGNFIEKNKSAVASIVLATNRNFIRTKMTKQQFDIAEVLLTFAENGCRTSRYGTIVPEKILKIKRNIGYFRNKIQHYSIAHYRV